MSYYPFQSFDTPCNQVSTQSNVLLTQCQALLGVISPTDLQAIINVILGIAPPSGLTPTQQAEYAQVQQCLKGQLCKRSCQPKIVCCEEQPRRHKKKRIVYVERERGCGCGNRW